MKLLQVGPCVEEVVIVVEVVLAVDVGVAVVVGAVVVELEKVDCDEELEVEDKL